MPVALLLQIQLSNWGVEGVEREVGSGRDIHTHDSESRVNVLALSVSIQVF